SYIPHPLLGRDAFEQFATDWVTFGMAYLERIDAKSGKALALKPALAKYMRRGVEDGRFFMVRNWQEAHEFKRDSVFQLREADVEQEIYGIPEWISAMHSALLNESATLFRRKYYNNGSHAGFILYMSDPAQSEEDVDAIREALKSARGPGNFRNLFMYAPGGKKDGIQLIPVSEVAAKDEFAGIKNITREDILAVLRIPPQLLGIVPSNAAGFGSIADASSVWARNELAPLQARMLKVNDWLGQEVIRFAPLNASG
ncbi:MAG: phage portal protein, partial [Pseudomonadota bacterium]|nr:phage portal protein [Pseudomonadota bacterium]